MNGKNHISKDKLETYIAEKFYAGESPGESDYFFEIEEHLCECDECAQQAHILYNQFKQISDWNVYQDNQTMLRLNLLEALKELESKTKSEKIKIRLAQWTENFKGLSGGSFQILVDMCTNGKRRTTKIITEGLEKLNISNPIAFDYSRALEPSRGGDDRETVINLNKLNSENTETPLAINLDKKKRKLTIEFKAGSAKELPMTVLLPSKSSGNSYIKEPTYNEIRNLWEIIFEDIPEGEYYFMFEPGYMG